MDCIVQFTKIKTIFMSCLQSVFLFYIFTDCVKKSWWQFIDCLTIYWIKFTFPLWQRELHFWLLAKHLHLPEQAFLQPHLMTPWPREIETAIIAERIDISLSGTSSIDQVTDHTSIDQVLDHTSSVDSTETRSLSAQLYTPTQMHQFFWTWCNRADFLHRLHLGRLIQ